jgi:hypothetical protein
MTVDELRARFWWLGPSKKESYIVGVQDDTVIVKVIQCTWNRRTQKYEDALAVDFARLGFRVKWRPFWCPKLQEQIEKGRESEEKAGQLFDEGAFVEMRRQAETRGLA